MRLFFCLYQPLANHDENKIRKIMNFYKKTYFIIAALIFLIGLSFLPFIKYFVKDITIDIHLESVYFLFLINSVFSYFLIYKRNLIYADQKNYKINIIHCFYLIFVNLFQLLILYFTKNYYLYLIIKIIFQLLENFAITILANKTYPFLKEKNKEKLDSKTEKEIFFNVKALFCHKVGHIFVNGTDNILIAKYFGLTFAGLYSNYYLVINSLLNMFSGVVSSLSASVGNLLLEKNYEKNFQVFRRVRFVNFMISCFCSLSVLNLMQSFIFNWIGKEYLLSDFVLYVLVLNLFQQLQRCCYLTFKSSAGIWKEDWYVPLLEAIFNIVFSLLCLKLFGFVGVFIGTIMSSMILWFYSYPRFVYQTLFHRSYKNYLLETFGYCFVFLMGAIISHFLLESVSNFFLQVLFTFLFNCIFLILVFRETENFCFFKKLIFNKRTKFIHK